ncbi:GL13451 [Drosophila persimilis]|uniref:GL13451 n=2 Tax=Drosophila persimilis TaxID=7234 RepID=B4GNN8_DROPE|nr:GL13451 [Drosophila persimilis]
MQATFKAFTILAIALMTHQVAAGTLSFGNFMGDVSQVAVAGEKAWHQLANAVGVSQPEIVQPETLNILSDMANGLGDLANAITSLSVETDYVQPEASNLLGDVLDDVGTGLGDLANAITSLSVQVKAGPQARSISSDGASIIAEGGAVSAKTIAAAANAAAPYIKKLNEGLGDLANALTNL